jgi:hypothetical protein
VTLEVTAAVASPPVVLVLQWFDDLGAGGGRARVVRVRVVDDDVDGAGRPAAIKRRLDECPQASSRAEPSMIMPLPRTSCACAMVPASPGTTRCFSNPKARQSHSIAAAASR